MESLGTFWNQSFTRYYKVLPSLIGFDLVLVDLVQPMLPGQNYFHPSLSTIDFYRILPNCK